MMVERSNYIFEHFEPALCCVFILMGDGGNGVGLKFPRFLRLQRCLFGAILWLLLQFQVPSEWTIYSSSCISQLCIC